MFHSKQTPTGDTYSTKQTAQTAQTIAGQAVVYERVVVFVFLSFSSAYDVCITFYMTAA